jgi:hypothetical protein
MEKFQEISGNKNYGTYPWRVIQGETRGMDLHIGTVERNSTALEVACPPPGIGAKKGQKSYLRPILELLTVNAVLISNVLS